MTTFSQVEANRPPSFVLVPPEAWSPRWEDRPVEEVCIGLRFVPDVELEDARIEAYRRADKLFPKWRQTPAERALFEASFHDALIRWVIARGTCDPNNARVDWEPWSAAAEDIAVELALTDLGAQLIFDAWEAMRVAADIGIPPATDADVALLAELALRLPALGEISRPRELRCRRLLRFVLEELEAVPAPTTPAASTRVDASPSIPLEP